MLRGRDEIFEPISLLLDFSDWHQFLYRRQF